jgi:hypothetical protein
MAWSLYNRLLCPWVCGIKNFLFKAWVDLSIDCRSSKRGMAKNGLYRFKIHASFKPVGGYGVSNRVRSDFPC